MLADDGMTVDHHSIYLQTWGVQLSVIIKQSHQYFIVRQICTLLGVNFDVQLAALSERELLDGMLEKLPVPTSKGIRDAWCIDIDAIGAWMIMISDRRVRAEVRPNLLKIQRDIMRAARRVMFGEVDQYATVKMVQDLTQYTWFLESQIIELQQERPRMILPESDTN